jgi:COX assembly protein 2
MLLHYFSKTYNDNIFVQIIEEFQKCHLDHPVKKFFGECTDLKIKLDRCFRQEVSAYHSSFLLCNPLNHNKLF